MTYLTAFLIFYAGLVTVSFIVLGIWVAVAPYGREIPGIGFVEDDADQRPDGDCFPFPLAGGFTGRASDVPTLYTRRRRNGETVTTATDGFGHLSGVPVSLHGGSQK